MTNTLSKMASSQQLEDGPEDAVISLFVYSTVGMPVIWPEIDLTLYSFDVLLGAVVVFRLLFPLQLHWRQVSIFAVQSLRLVRVLGS